MIINTFFSWDSPQDVKETSRSTFWRGRDTNNIIWKCNIELCDNETISIGTIVHIIAPHPAEIVVTGDLPMMETWYPIIMMKRPNARFDPIPINHNIQRNTHLAFFPTATHVVLNITSPEETMCLGLFCGKQRLDYWVGHRDSGCYSMTHCRSSLAMAHSIAVAASDNTKNCHEEF